jgi:hypothetical protein
LQTGISTAAALLARTVAAFSAASTAFAQSPPAAKGDLPPNYRQLIVDEVKRNLTVQTKIRNATISNPSMSWGGSSGRAEKFRRSA